MNITNLEILVNTNGIKVLYDMPCAKNYYLDEVDWNTRYEIDQWLKTYKHIFNFVFDEFKIGDDDIPRFIDNDIWNIETEEQLNIINAKFKKIIDLPEVQLCYRLHKEEYKSNNNTTIKESMFPDSNTIISILENYDNFQELFDYLKFELPTKELLKKTEKVLNETNNKTNKIGLLIKKFFEDRCFSKKFRPFGLMAPQIKNIYHEEKYERVDYMISASSSLQINDFEFIVLYDGDNEGSGNTEIIIYNSNTKMSNSFTESSDFYINEIKQIMKHFGFEFETQNMTHVSNFNKLFLEMIGSVNREEAEIFIGERSLLNKFNIDANSDTETESETETESDLELESDTDVDH